MQFMESLTDIVAKQLDMSEDEISFTSTDMQ